MSIVTSSSLGSTSSSSSSIHKLVQRTSEYGLNLDSFIPYGTKPKVRGARAARFHPKSPTGIYAKLINNFDEMNFIVQDLVKTMSNDITEVRQLLQVVPDLLLIDYQLVQYSSQEYDTVIGTTLEMQAMRQEHLEECDIIYTHKSKYAKDLCKMLDVFLWKLCCELTRTAEILPTFSRVMRYFTSFLRHMADSAEDSLRLTAYMFAVTLNKYLHLRKVKLALAVREIDLDVESLRYDAIVTIQRECNIDAIYKGRQFNCVFLPYYKEFVKCSQLCLKIDCDEPYFANEKNLQLLGDLLALKNYELIHEVLNSCTSLVLYSHLQHTHNTDVFKSIVAAIYKRVNREEVDIAMKAATFFSVCFRNGVPLSKLEDIIRLLIHRSYSINLQLAEICGQALTHYLQSNPPAEIYKTLLKFVEIFDKNSHNRLAYVKYSYFVEALYHHLDEIKPITILKFLGKNSNMLTVDECKGLMEILYHSCCMSINGKIAAQRNRRHICMSTESASHYLIADGLLSHAQKLIERAEVNYDIAAWLFKSLALVNYSGDVYQLKEKILHIMDESLKLLSKSERIHPELSRTTAAFIEKASSVDETYLLRLEQKLVDYTISFADAIEDYKSLTFEEDDEALQLKLSAINWSTKIQAILKCNVSVVDVTLDHFYSNWENSSLPVEIIEAQITCCALYFKLQVRNLMNTHDFHKLNKTIFKYLKKQAISVWIDMDKYLKKKIDCDQTMKIVMEAMWTFICGYNEFFSQETILHNRHVCHAYFDHLTIWTTAEHVFSKIYEECFLEKSDVLPINTRRTYIRGAFMLFGCNRTPHTKYIVQIITWYEKFSKLYQDEYKEFFDGVRKFDRSFFYQLIMEAVCFAVDHQEDDTQNVDMEELCNLLGDLLDDYETEKFLEDFVTYVQQNMKYEVLKYMSFFTTDISPVALKRLNQYAKGVLSEEYFSQF